MGDVGLTKVVSEFTFGHPKRHLYFCDEDIYCNGKIHFPLVAVLTMAQVDVVGEVMDVIEVVTDKQLHKVGDEVTWQVTKEVRDIMGE